MKFPYGISSFSKIIMEGHLYIDRTDRIPLLEETGEYLLFLRPRRFGKSLWMSVLQQYYDLKRADEFERLFGHLAIGKNPTARRNQYFILKWDFSAVSAIGRAPDIQRSLYNYLNLRITKFALNYKDVLPIEIEIFPDDAPASFQSLLTAVSQTPYSLYLMIDEYDNFANEVMMNPAEIGKERYEDLVYGEGCLRYLFKVLKAATAGEGLDRMFLTGVSPVVMSDITSAHNITENIYFKPEFNDLCGFTEQELRELLAQFVEKKTISPQKADEALEMMRTFYNGYTFAYDTKPSLYNPTLALFFLKHLQDYGTYPREFLDSNLATDYTKLRYISQLPGGPDVILNALDEQNPLTVQQVAQRFGVREMVQAKNNKNFTGSLLYCLGMLTLSGNDPMGEIILAIPNLTSRKLYIERVQEMLFPDIDTPDVIQIVKAFYSTGNIAPLCELLEQRYLKVFDNRDYRWTNELTIKTIFLMVLFNDTAYLMDSETSLERGYADLTLIVRPDMRQYTLLDLVVEFKYASLQELGLSGKQVKAAAFDEIRTLKPVLQKQGEAKAALEQYRHTLQATYGERLRLRTYSVVALGFERLVWQEI